MIASSKLKGGRTLATLLDLIIITAGCLLPLWPLRDISFDFAYEWKIHLYNVAYFGEYFRQHFIFPSTINTQDLVGWVIPLFYGTRFYEVTGLLASFTGAAIAYRLFILIAFLIQYTLAKKVVESFGGDRFFSQAFALLLTWAIYPLTNIYNRSAATEFAAVAALNCGFFCWILILNEPDRWKKTIVPWALGFCFAFSAGSHPITAVYGGLTFLVFWFFTFAGSQDKKYLLKISFFSGLAAVIVIFPWATVVLKFHGYLQVNHLAEKIWFSPIIDALTTKLNLFPYDPRPPDDSTPHLDAQIATPFLIFAIFALVALFRNISATKKIVRPR